MGSRDLAEGLRASAAVDPRETGARRVVRSCLAWARVPPDAARRLEMEAAGLTAEETARLQGRHGRSVAGFVALKHALAALFSEVCAGAAAAPAEFVLDHDAKGAPIVVSLPRRLRERVEGAADGRVLVSVSHTRGLACGLAVFEEERRGSARNLARD